MVGLAKRLTHRIVIPALIGSNPIFHPSLDFKIPGAINGTWNFFLCQILFAPILGFKIQAFSFGRAIFTATMPSLLLGLKLLSSRVL